MRISFITYSLSAVYILSRHSLESGNEAYTFTDFPLFNLNIFSIKLCSNGYDCSTEILPGGVMGAALDALGNVGLLKKLPFIIITSS